MNTSARLVLAPALAALALVLFEVLRTLLTGATHLGGGAVGFAAAVAGLLGLPLWLAGVVALGSGRGVWAGWRWGRGGAEGPSGARVVAWVVYLGLALVVITLVTQVGAARFIKAFNKLVYQSLASGLLAAGTALVMAVLSGPVVGALARGVGWVSAKLPRAVDPTGRRGAIGWVVGLLVVGAVVAPLVLKPLHTVDLRPARLVLGWAVAVWVFDQVVGRRVLGWRGLAVGAGLAVVFAGCFAWSAGSLGDSQRRRLALQRDTVVAGSVAARLGKLGDGDGDGVPGSFAGGDCDDADPAVRPGVYDAPDDEVDQNCTGADLVLAEDPLQRPERAATGRRADYNVVLLTVDALRDDTMRAEMGRLRGVAEAGVDYRNAYSHGAATYWSVPALLASTMPSRLEMGRDQTPVAGMKLLTEVLRDSGWHTALFANVTIFFVRGLRQGAQVADYETSAYTVHGAKPGSEHMTSGVLAHIDRWREGALKPQRKKFFVWAHYYDPHDPYFEVPGFPAEDGSDGARYRAITRYLDRELGRLFDGLRERGLWENTVVIVTADHGDEFGEHGHRFHGRTLYEEMVHVPLVMHVPGVERRVVERPIGQMEVAPTLLELLGVQIPREWVGRSRVDELRTGQPAPVEPVFFEVFPDSNYDAHQVGMRLGDMKLIYRLNQNIFELYDLAADPGERDNVFDTHPDAEGLRRELMVYLDHHLYQLAQGKTGAKLPPGAPDPKAAKRSRKRAPKRRSPRKRAPKPAVAPKAGEAAEAGAGAGPARPAEAPKAAPRSGEPRGPVRGAEPGGAAGPR